MKCSDDSVVSPNEIPKKKKRNKFRRKAKFDFEYEEFDKVEMYSGENFQYTD